MGAFARHQRFFLALALGLLIWAAAHAGSARAAERALMGFDAFCLAYLAMMARHASLTTPEDLRRHAEADDEGIALILTLAIAAVATSLSAIWLVLSATSPAAQALPATLALAAVPLGWGMVHTLAAFRYAHLHYAPDEACRLDFPGEAAPGPWDFLYFAFTLGMTAQTSDVVVATARMRRVVLFHSVGAFFYNTVILALAVNAGLALAR